MPPLVLASLIAGVAALGTAAVGYFSNKATNDTNASNIKETNQLNAQLQRETNQQSIVEAQKNRSYYSPANMMSMLRSAGLNSNLVSSQAVTGSGAGIPTLNAPTASPAVRTPFNPSQYENPVRAALDARKSIAETNNINGDTALKGSQIQVNEHTILNLDAQTMKNKEELIKVRSEVSRISEEILNIRQQTATLFAQMENYDENTRSQFLMNCFAHRKMQAELDDMYARIRLANSTAAKTDEEKRFLAASLGLRLVGLQLDNDVKAASYFNISHDTALKLNQNVNQILLNYGLQIDNASKSLIFDENQSKQEGRRVVRGTFAGRFFDGLTQGIGRLIGNISEPIVGSALRGIGVSLAK